MDSYRTVVIVGAGASAELGLPVGSELKDRIAQLFTTGKGSRDQATFEAAGHADRDEEQHAFERKHWEAGQRIAQGMSQAVSIDNYINDHRDNTRIAVTSKIAIVRCITEAEQRCPLHDAIKDRPRIHQRSPAYFDFTKTEDTWLNTFFKFLTQGCTLQELKVRLSGVTFVIFNYDRCVEAFAVMWVARYHHISHIEAAKIVSAIQIYHPYGKVGELTWQSAQGDRLPFGHEPDGEELYKLSAGIRTFTESSSDRSEIADIQQSLQRAQQVFFLGFGFIDLNMRLLANGIAPYSPRRIIGTAYGVSPFNLSVIRSSIQEMFNTPDKEIHLADQTCKALVVNFSKALEPK